MQSKLYIGITGITRLEEIDFILEITDLFPEIFAKRKIMLGFLMNEPVSLNFYEKTPSLKIVTMPKMCALMEYCRRITDKDKFMKIIHYSSDNSDFEKPIFNLITYIDRMDGFQLNINNPNLNEIESMQRAFSNIELIYQLKPNILNDIEFFYTNHSEVELNIVKKINHLLIDPSEGKGIPNNVERILEITNSLRKKGFNNLLGFAGGLSGSNLVNFKEIIKDFSIDTQSSIRTDGKIDKVKLQSYLRSAIALILQ